MVLQHGFEALGLHRIGLRVLSTNETSIQCHPACGFRHEGVARQSVKVGDQWRDEVITGGIVNRPPQAPLSQSELHPPRPWL